MFNKLLISCMGCLIKEKGKRRKDEGWEEEER